MTTATKQILENLEQMKEETQEQALERLTKEALQVIRDFEKITKSKEYITLQNAVETYKKVLLKKMQSLGKKTVEVLEGRITLVENPGQSKVDIEAAEAVLGKGALEAYTSRNGFQFVKCTLGKNKLPSEE